MKRCRSDNMISIFCDELFVCSIRAVRIRVPYILRSRSSLLGDDTRTMVANSGSTDTTLFHVERPKWRFVSKRLPRRRQLLPQTTVNSLVPYTTNSKGSSSRCKDGTVGRGTISTENNISAAFFFFVANEKDNLCTCYSGNIFPIDRYVGFMILLNPMADTVDRQRSTSRGS